MNKLKNIFSKYVFKKDRINFFLIINVLIAILLVVFLFIRFKTLWLMVIFSLIIFFVRWKRQMLGIHLTLEPIILFSVIMLKLAGLKYALVVSMLPVLLSDLISGRLRQGTFISMFCKGLVLFCISLFPGQNLILITIISYIIFNEGIGTVMALLAGCEIDRILTQVFTSTIIRLVYLNLFLMPLCRLVGAMC